MGLSTRPATPWHFSTGLSATALRAPSSGSSPGSACLTSVQILMTSELLSTYKLLTTHSTLITSLFGGLLTLRIQGLEGTKTIPYRINEPTNETCDLSYRF